MMQTTIMVTDAAAAAAGAHKCNECKLDGTKRFHLDTLRVATVCFLGFWPNLGPPGLPRGRGEAHGARHLGNERFPIQTNPAGDVFFFYVF